jgi:hypothetical protein
MTGFKKLKVANLAEGVGLNFWETLGFPNPASRQAFLRGRGFSSPDPTTPVRTPPV